MNNYQLPLDVERTIADLCLGYKRRRNALLDVERLCPATAAEFMRVNNAIDAALNEECEDGIRQTMLEDLAVRRGHRTSPLYAISPNTYKARKMRTKYNIARRLSLI